MEVKTVLKEIDLDKGSFDQIDKLIRSRSERDINKYKEIVQEILSEVKSNKDQAVFRYTEKFDGFKLSNQNIEVKNKEIKAALNQVDSSFLKSLKKAALNIKEFHLEQKDHSWQKVDSDGKITGQICRPLQKAGIYVPGGRASYPSSVLMTAIPAKIAGVGQIIMVTPPDKRGNVDSKILAAAEITGVDRIFKIGGAQAIAALGYGTETIPAVDIIVGPGNRYVTIAKQLVFGQVKIDMTAGPSEIMILADQTADPEYIAADLMSQAEHDPLASSILVTDSKKLAQNVKIEINKQVKELTTKDTILKSFKNYGLIVHIRDLKQGISLINKVAPEHLELSIKNPFDLLGLVKNSGSIFLGSYSPEPIGDYYAGPNHVLPTAGTARFFSPLSVRDFVKFSSYIYYNKKAFIKAADHVIELAEGEGLTAHANSIKVRKKVLAGEANES
ncbi:MAG: histidinol dehydrogenase [Halanaerobiales bacterium]|nr:histidinol dehydrogenase [Halanaerobiales bacterium]